ncbi:peroxiredoxin family protein [Saccharospirillum impatiens]|uniref:peroxiredoxin family protein n=1 Tax=Saccharospirillum impatiens TaxID=169438 RepID=UPI0003FA4FC3|nr:peroxiredoxin-like family protein [Saccharospirillum impatiens]
MRIQSPDHHPEFSTQDIFGRPLDLSDYRGKKVMLSFFRDAACPFCNFRVHELTHRYKSWQDKGLEVVAVFCSPGADVRDYVARHPRPFRLVSDPDLTLYDRYGVEQSSTALIRAMLFKFPRIIKGMKTGGRPRSSPTMKLVPADFLIDEQGRIVETWYGRDASDHIPLDRVHAFIGGDLSHTSEQRTAAQ